MLVAACPPVGTVSVLFPGSHRGCFSSFKAHVAAPEVRAPEDPPLQLSFDDVKKLPEDRAALRDGHAEGARPSLLLLTVTQQ